MKSKELEKCYSTLDFLSKSLAPILVFLFCFQFGEPFGFRTLKQSNNSSAILCLNAESGNAKCVLNLYDRVDIDTSIVNAVSQTSGII